LGLAASSLPICVPLRVSLQGQSTPRIFIALPGDPRPYARGLSYTSGARLKPGQPQSRVGDNEGELGACQRRPMQEIKRASAPVGLLRDCCARGLECYESRRSHLVDHRLNNNRHHPSALHIERVGSTRREIEDASASVWTPVVDFDDDGVAVAEIRHLRVRGEWKRTMRCGGGNGVEDLAISGLPAHKVVPSSFPKQSGSGRAPPPATGLRDAIAPICRGLETCERLLRHFGSYCRRTHHSDQTLAETRRF